MADAEGRMLEDLETVAHRLGLDLRYDKLYTDEVLSTHSGSCTLHGRQLLIVDRGLGTAARLSALRGFLRQQDLSNLYLKPAVRDYLEADPPE